jgi:transaldolase
MAVNVPFRRTARRVSYVVLALMTFSLRNGGVPATTTSESWVGTVAVAAFDLPIRLQQPRHSTRNPESTKSPIPRTMYMDSPAGHLPRPDPRDIPHRRPLPRRPGDDALPPPPSPWGLRLFLDTADTSAWSELLPTGIFHGVTCNPTLLERAGHACTVESLHQLAARALRGGAAPPPAYGGAAATAAAAAVAPPPTDYAWCDEFMCQAWGATAEELVSSGLALSGFDRTRVVVKVPVTAQGAQAAQVLVGEGVRVCLTACYSAQQAIIAAGIGAEYLAPYCGRMDDEGLDGKAECRKMQSVVRGCHSATRILVASIRNVETLTDLAAAGMETFTISPDVARVLFQVDLTDQAALEFEQAAE